MNKEVALIDRAPPAVPVFGMNDLERVATAIAKGGLFGSKDPYAVLTLCMLAQAEGQHPAVVFRDYDLIQGKPAKKAEAMLRDFIAGGGKVTWNKLDDECAEATFAHPQGGTVTINWTMARAAKAGLANKDTWKKFPRQMLRSRVVSEGVRTVYPNATSGLYVPEEVRDFGEAPKLPADTPPTPEPKRARDLKAQPVNGNREKAEKWVAEFVEGLSFADVEQADAAFAKNAKALAKLEREHADLYAQVAALKPTPNEPTVAQEAVAKVKARLEAAPDAEAVEAIIAETAQHMAYLPEDAQMTLEIAFSKARDRVG